MELCAFGSFESLEFTCALDLNGALVLAGAGDVLASLRGFARPAGRGETGRAFLLSVWRRAAGEGGRL